MSNFRYRGRSGRGDLITGKLEAETIDAVATRLLNLGITPLHIAPDSTQATNVQDLMQRLGAGRPSNADIVLNHLKPCIYVLFGAIGMFLVVFVRFRLKIF